MKLYDAIQKIPAGTMLVPTLIGALIHTFCPQVLQVGNPTQVLFTSEGMQVCVGMMLFFTGTQLALGQIRPVLRSILPTLAFKMVVAYALAALYFALFGLDGVWGVSALAFTIAITSCNAVLFLATVKPYGGVAESAMFGEFMIPGMPALPLLFLSGTSGGGIDWMGLASTCIPLGLGMVLGNVDARFREMFKGGSSCIIPFFGFQFGSLVDLGTAAGQLVQGVGLVVAFYALSAIPLYAFERLVLHRPGHVGVATCSVAGIAVSFPTMAAASSAAYLPYVDGAISQLAMAMFATTFLTPVIAHFIARRNGAPRTDGLAESGEAAREQNHVDGLVEGLENPAGHMA